MKLTFWGAARTVTGSMHQLTIEGRSYLLDCGQYQGRRKEAEARNKAFPFRRKTYLLFCYLMLISITAATSRCW
jgi:metallo-beta-lactamase family protein